jgi:hypothetical protein
MRFNFMYCFLFKILLFMLFCIIIMPIDVDAKIYKWVDENGTIHFSDKPYSGDAKEVNVKGTGISVSGTSTPTEKKNTTSVVKDTKKPEKKPIKPEKPKEVTEADYRITSNVGKIGADTIRIAGRLNSGPRCENLTVEVSATSDTGLSAAVKTSARKVTSHGSAAFEGYAKVAGSAEDFGFWEVTKVKVRCTEK